MADKKAVRKVKKEKHQKPTDVMRCLHIASIQIVCAHELKITMANGDQLLITADLHGMDYDENYAELSIIYNTVEEKVIPEHTETEVTSSIELF